jgi:hypothetical protein
MLVELIQVIENLTLWPADLSAAGDHRRLPPRRLLSSSRSEGRHSSRGPAASLTSMATAPSEPLSQRLATIREQLKLLADYL